MNCPYFENGFVRHLDGHANMIAYLSKGFRGWQLFGFVKDEDGFIGLNLDGGTIVPVYGTEFSTKLQSDDNPVKEQKQIDEGKTAILCFYGTDNCSWMRRITPEEFKSLSLTRFIQQPDDLFYNS